MSRNNTSENYTAKKLKNLRNAVVFFVKLCYNIYSKNMRCTYEHQTYLGFEKLQYGVKGL